MVTRRRRLLRLGAASVAAAAVLALWPATAPAAPVTAPSAVLAAVPPTVPPSVPGGSVPPDSVPPTTVLAPAMGPLIPIPAGCTGPAPALAVFSGTLVALDDPEAPSAARYRVHTLLAGSLAGYQVGEMVDVRYGDEARFLAVDGDYIVGVRTNEVGVLVSTAREPAPLFGGDAVIGVDDTDTECPTLEDPVRTLLADGTAVDTGVLSPLRGHSGELRAALLKPLLFALGGLVLLVLLKQLLFSFGRETRRRAGVARRGTPSTPRARRGWSQPT